MKSFDKELFDGLVDTFGKEEFTEMLVKLETIKNKVAYEMAKENEEAKETLKESIEDLSYQLHTKEVVIETLEEDLKDLSEKLKTESSKRVWAETLFMSSVAVLKVINGGKYSNTSIMNAIRKRDVSLLEEPRVALAVDNRHTKRCPKTGRFIK